LSFVKESGGAGWAGFLKTYTEKTRRAPRDIEASPELAAFNSPVAPGQVRVRIDMGPELPMYSMRNPPIFALPSAGIRERDGILSKHKKMLQKLKTSK
jgi:hypothetical protein